MAKKKGNAGRKPFPPGSQRMGLILPPATLAQLARVRDYYSCTSDSEAVRRAVAIADGAIPADFKPPQQ